MLMVFTILMVLLGTKGYYFYAIKHNIVSNPNFRSLHQIAKPRGAGIILSTVFLFSIVILWLDSRLEVNTILVLLLGGLASTLIGFVDDIVEIKAATKLCMQFMLAGWILYSFGWRPLLSWSLIPFSVNLALSWLGLVWLMNLYNFMDGSDGMAASGAIFFCLTSIFSLIAIGGDWNTILVFGLLAASCFGFLLFNFPPATLFMGDSGSLFLGYIFGALITLTVTSNQMPLWVWLIMLAYFIGDTTTTLVLRIFLVKRWYGVHRSNAYQNLARISGSHLKVLKFVSYYHFLWLFPLAIASVLLPKYTPYAFALAYIPVISWTLIYGPRLSTS